MTLRGGQRFNLETFLASRGLPPTIVRFMRGEVIFSQGDAADSVMYVQKGRVKKSVSFQGRPEAVVAMLGPGDFFGEACLVGQRVRMKNAIAITESTVLVIDKATMMRLLRTRHALADGFIAHLLTRIVRIEGDLIDQLVSSTEQRLARTLLLLARYGKRGEPKKVLPRLSQTTLAGMVGSTRPRINELLKKFKRLGFIDMNDGLTVHRSLLRAALRSSSPHRVHHVRLATERR
jgi:CRP/FNR family cyclic AMP-dependent transcriptional regulator